MRLIFLLFAKRISLSIQKVRVFLILADMPQMSSSYYVLLIDVLIPLITVLWDGILVDWSSLKVHKDL